MTTLVIRRQIQVVFFSIYDNTPPLINVIDFTDNFNVPENEPFIMRWVQSDNIDISNHIFEYSSDGINYEILLETSDYAQLDSTILVSPVGVTNIASIKLTVSDEAGNIASDTSSFFRVTDNTHPVIDFSSSLNDTTVYTAGELILKWTSSDNVNVEYVNLDYRNGDESWVVIADDETADTQYNWIVPNVLTDELQIRVIAFDAVGLSDTSIVNNIKILAGYPIVENVFPSPGLMNWTNKEFKFDFSIALDTSTINANNISIISNHSDFLIPTIFFNDSTFSILITYDQGLATMDSIKIILSDQITSIYGYPLDGNQDGQGGGDYSIDYVTPMLADYDNNGVINLEDLSQFVIGLDTDNYSYELGPFTGEIPNVFVDVDNIYDIEDIVGFAMMWNWYFANNPSSFQSLADEGSISNIEMAHDSIFIDIPNGLSAYQVQISYEPCNVVINNSKKDNESELFLTKRSSEHGVYTIMATPNSRKIAIPIQIIGKNAQVSVSYKGMDTNGELHGQMTRSKNIENLPDDFVLYANYPNPFNPQTRIDFGLPVTGHVNLKIYDIMGREVVTLLNETISAGYKSILWNATNKSGQPVSAGMYFYALQVKDFMKIKKMVLLK